MKNIKLILVAVSLSLVSFNMASGVITPLTPSSTNQKCIDNCTKSCTTSCNTPQSTSSKMSKISKICIDSCTKSCTTSCNNLLKG